MGADGGGQGRQPQGPRLRAGSALFPTHAPNEPDTIRPGHPRSRVGDPRDRGPPVLTAARRSEPQPAAPIRPRPRRAPRTARDALRPLALQRQGTRHAPAAATAAAPRAASPLFWSRGPAAPPLTAWARGTANQRAALPETRPRPAPNGHAPPRPRPSPHRPAHPRPEPGMQAPGGGGRSRTCRGARRAPIGQSVSALRCRQGAGRGAGGRGERGPTQAQTQTQSWAGRRGPWVPALRPGLLRVPVPLPGWTSRGLSPQTLGICLCFS